MKWKENTVKSQINLIALGKQIYKIAEHKITMDFPQQIEGMRFNNAEIVKFRGGVFGGF